MSSDLKLGMNGEDFVLGLLSIADGFPFGLAGTEASPSAYNLSVRPLGAPGHQILVEDERTLLVMIAHDGRVCPPDRLDVHDRHYVARWDVPEEWWQHTARWWAAGRSAHVCCGPRLRVIEAHEGEPWILGACVICGSHWRWQQGEASPDSVNGWRRVLQSWGTTARRARAFVGLLGPPPSCAEIDQRGWTDVELRIHDMGERQALGLDVDPEEFGEWERCVLEGLAHDERAYVIAESASLEPGSERPMVRFVNDPLDPSLHTIPLFTRKDLAHQELWRNPGYFVEAEPIPVSAVDLRGCLEQGQGWLGLHTNPGLHFAEAMMFPVPYDDGGALAEIEGFTPSRR
jgi:hypothetical protein